MKSIAVRLYPTDEIAVLSDLFQMATTEYRSTHSTFGRKNPSLRLIEMFLELGINPNQRLRTNPNKTHLSDDTMTIWQFVISDSAKRPELLKLFLRYGADPFVSELAKPELYEGKHDFWEVLEATRLEASKKGDRWDDAQSARRTNFKWSRFRDQKLFGRITQRSHHHSDSSTTI